MSIQADLIELVADMLDVSRDTIDPQAPLHTLGLDSMRLVEIMVFIETRYGVDLMDDNLKREEMATLDALAQTIEGKQTP